MGNNLTPLEVAEALIGKPDVIADILGIDHKAPFQWRYGRPGRAAGDLPKVAYVRALLAYSDERRLGLTLTHLIWGAEAAEIDEILSRRTPAVAAE